MWALVVIAIIVVIIVVVARNKAKKAAGDQGAATGNSQQAEKKKQQDEAKRFNPAGKNMEWFASEDGMQAYSEYITVQNYFLEETIKTEKEKKYSDYELETVIRVIHKDAKVPYIFFSELVKNIHVQALDYVGPTEMLIKILELQARPYYIDDDGEPQPYQSDLTPAELVSVEKNPVLNFISNFNCFELKDDVQGSWKDKYALLSSVMIWLGIYGATDKDILANNPWVFAKESYINEMGTVRKEKGFFKKAMEVSSYREYFEKKVSECE